MAGCENGGFFSVRLGLFDGPLDLLLHLVKQRELPLEKLSLAEVADQYLQAVESMRNLDLDLAGEYLVIAATLVSIKAALLLNEPVDLVSDDEGNLVNPHDELLRRLREAEVFKDGANRLGTLSFLGIDVFAPPPLAREAGSMPPRYQSHDPLALGRAFRRLWERLDSRAASYTITLDAVSIIECMVKALDRLRTAGGPLRFEDLVPNLESRASIIATFVALLELCKRQAIRVKQGADFEEIVVCLAEADFDPTLTGSEFDAAAAGMAANS